MISCWSWGNCPASCQSCFSMSATSRRAASHASPFVVSVKVSIWCSSCSLRTWLASYHASRCASKARSAAEKRADRAMSSSCRAVFFHSWASCFRRSPEAAHIVSSISSNSCSARVHRYSRYSRVGAPRMRCSSNHCSCLRVNVATASLNALRNGVVAASSDQPVRCHSCMR